MKASSGLPGKGVSTRITSCEACGWQLCLQPVPVMSSKCACSMYAPATEGLL